MGLGFKKDGFLMVFKGKICHFFKYSNILAPKNKAYLQKKASQSQGKKIECLFMTQNPSNIATDYCI